MVSVMAEAAVDMKSDPAYFFCDRLSCWMKRDRCVQYRIMARMVRDGLKANFLANKRYLSCLHCDQGAQIEYQITGRIEPMTKPTAPPSPSRKQQQPASKALTNPCQECGKNEAIIDKNGVVVNNLCRDCFAQKRKDAASTITRHRLKVVLDFTDYPATLDAITSRAKDRFRTVEQQIMWDVTQLNDEFRDGRIQAQVVHLDD
jgi:ribosomal protein S14